MSEASVIKKVRPDNLLFRSHIEISRIMQVLAKEHCHIAANVGHGHLFKAFLLAADAASDNFAISYSPNKELNTLLLGMDSIEFTATDPQGLNFTFATHYPEEIQIGEQPAIQFPLPKSLLLHSRREHVRVSTNGGLSVRCIADAGGFMPFESHITDVSHDGLGVLIYDMSIKLEAGAVLKGNQIILPNGGAITADLELRHIATNRLADGTEVHRAGFRFLHAPGPISQLISLFIQDLDKK